MHYGFRNKITKKKFTYENDGKLFEAVVCVVTYVEVVQCTTLW